jgi:hypothetical protein
MEFDSRVLTSLFTLTALAISALVIRICARTRCTGGESSSRQLLSPALAPTSASASSVWAAGAGASPVPPPIHTRLLVAVVSAGAAFRIDRIVAVSYHIVMINTTSSPIIRVRCWDGPTP